MVRLLRDCENCGGALVRCECWD